MPHELKTRMTVQMFDISFGSCEKVIGTDDFMSLSQKSVDQMRSKKPSTASHKDAFSAVIKSCHAELQFNYLSATL